jgi:hypothetical protein
MKYLLFLSLPLVTIFFAPKTAEARIGETRDTFESRLFGSGGVIYRNKDERSTRRQSGPYSNYMEFLGSSAVVQVYFKSDVGRQPSLKDFEDDTLGTGWEVHVLYVSGKSVFESYKRIGSISEYEFNALLGILAGGKYWEKAEKKGSSGRSQAVGAVEAVAAADEEEEDPTVFGFDFVRSDGNVRAKKSGGGLMVFQTQLDEFLAKQKKSTLMQKAPQSVQGF